MATRKKQNKKHKAQNVIVGWKIPRAKPPTLPMQNPQSQIISQDKPSNPITISSNYPNTYSKTLPRCTPVSATPFRLLERHVPPPGPDSKHFAPLPCQTQFFPHLPLLPFLKTPESSHGQSPFACKRIATVIQITIIATLEFIESQPRGTFHQPGSLLSLASSSCSSAVSPWLFLFFLFTNVQALSGSLSTFPPCHLPGALL